MILRDYGHRASDLLRLAPWVDLGRLRKTFATDLLAEIEAHPNSYSDVVKKGAREFADGERHYMRGCAGFRNVLTRTLNSMYPIERAHDQKYGHAYQELKLYFFNSDEYVGIHQ